MVAKYRNKTKLLKIDIRCLEKKYNKYEEQIEVITKDINVICKE